MTTAKHRGIVSAFVAIAIALCLASSAVGGSPDSVLITAYGPVGTNDDSAVFQAALDDAERRGAALEIPAGTTVNLRGTVYIGNNTLHAAGAIINVLLDKDFHPRGVAPRRTEGAILTKASPGAKFGRDTVNIAFDQLTISTHRSTDLAVPKTGFLLENVASLSANTLFVSAIGTGRSEVNPVDFFSGVQNVAIDRMVVRMDNPGAHGGFWIRNFSPKRATANIRIRTIDLAGATGDELLSIFNSGDARADLHDIRIGHVDARPSGGGGMGLSIYRNAGGWNPASMHRITIDSVDITVGRIGPLADSTGGFALKVQNCSAAIGMATIRYIGPWSPKLPYVFGIRYAPALGQTAPLFIPAITIEVKARNPIPPRSAAMLYGPIRTDRLVVRGSGTGFRQIAYGADMIGEADVRAVLGDGDPFLQTRAVRGTVNGKLVKIER